MHTAEELDRSVYRVSPDDYLDECARRERKVGRWFIHFDRSCEEFEAGASVSDNAGKKAALDAESSGPGGRKHESSPPSTVVELPSGGCICRARINIAQHIAARIEGKPWTARRVFRYSGRTTARASYFCRPTFYAERKKERIDEDNEGGMRDLERKMIERRSSNVSKRAVTMVVEERRRVTHVGLGRGKNRSQSPLLVACDSPELSLRVFEDRLRPGEGVNSKIYFGFRKNLTKFSIYYANRVQSYMYRYERYSAKARSGLSDDNNVRSRRT